MKSRTSSFGDSLDINRLASFLLHASQYRPFRSSWSKDVILWIAKEPLNKCKCGINFLRVVWMMYLSSIGLVSDAMISWVLSSSVSPSLCSTVKRISFLYLRNEIL